MPPACQSRVAASRLAVGKRCQHPLRVTWRTPWWARRAIEKNRAGHQKVGWSLSIVDEAAVRRSALTFWRFAVARGRVTARGEQRQATEDETAAYKPSTPVSLSAACFAKSADAERRTTRQAHRAAPRALRYAVAARRRPKPRPNRPAARAGRRRQKKPQQRKPWRRPPPPARAASAPSRT